METEPLRIAVCEDEKQERARLEQALEASPIPCRTDYFQDGEAMLRHFFCGKYNLVLMDIYMEGMDGITAVSHIRRNDPHVPIAFLTSSRDHAMEGYRFHVDRYLAKPVGKKDLEEVLHLALSRLKMAPSVTVSSGGRTTEIPLARIRYGEQKGHSLFLYLDDGETRKLSMKLSDFLEMLPQPPFLRCHKSFFVNLPYVRFLNRELLVFEMTGGGNAYIRRESRPAAESAYRSFMFDRARESLNDEYEN